MMLHARQPIISFLPKSLQRTSFRTVSSTMPKPIIELREYDIKPEQLKSYMEATSNAAELRKSLVPLRLFTLPETGGSLNVATHLYYYEGGLEERDEKRSQQGGNEDWVKYLKSVKPCVQRQKSAIFVEADLVKDREEICGFGNESLSRENHDECIYEMRRYKLKLGYDTLPNMLAAYDKGLSSKLQAEGTDESTSLISVMYCEVGQLNEVIEIWRHGHGVKAMQKSREASRKIHDWRLAISEIAEMAIEFTCTIHKPTSFSPFK